MIAEKTVGGEWVEDLAPPFLMGSLHLLPMRMERVRNNFRVLERGPLAAVSTTGGREREWCCAAGRRHGGYRRVGSPRSLSALGGKRTFRHAQHNLA